MDALTASDIRVSDVGRTIRSIVYPGKGKNAKPWRRSVTLPDGTIVFRAVPQTFVIESLYVHKNGNILINQGYYLRADTEIEFVETEEQ